MTGLFAFPTLIFLVTLPVFLRAEYRSGRSVVLPLKLICSLCFVAIGLVGLLLGERGSVPAYDGLMLAGLSFSLMGDMLLVWSDRRQPFLLGLVAFLIAQLLYTAAFTLANGFSGWDALVFAAIVAAVITAYNFLNMELGKMKLPVLAYVAAISAMLAKAISTLYLGGINGPAAGLVVAGAALFFASDGFLALFKFQRRKINAYRGINLVTYYLGQMLLALSLYFF